MSHVLYRLGRFAARRPWRVIGAWLVVAVAVIGASGLLRPRARRLRRACPASTPSRPSICSSAAQLGRRRPHRLRGGDPARRSTFFDSAELGRAGRRREALAGLPTSRHDRSGRRWPNVVGAADRGGWRRRRPGGAAAGAVPGPRDSWARTTSTGSRKPWPEARVDTGLRIEMGGDLFFAFEQPETGTGEIVGLVAAVVILLLAFGSVIAMGLPDRHGHLRSRRQRELDVVAHVPRRPPELGHADRHHDRARRRHRLRPVPRHPPPRVPRPGHDRRRSRPAGRWRPPARPWSSPAAPSSSPSSVSPSRASRS